MEKQMIELTKEEIIKMYLNDLNNLVSDSDAKTNRINQLKDQLICIIKHDLESCLNDYIKEKHSQDECSGFIDGYKRALAGN